MHIGWERAGDDLIYLVDDEPVGAGERGFDRVLELAAATSGPVTLRISELTADGRDLRDGLPFAARFDELERRLRPGQLRYELL